MNFFRNVVLIGEGTYGKVYKATAKDTEETVAVKKIIVEPGVGLSLTTIREIKMLKKLRSKHTVILHDIIHEKEFLHLVMEFLPFDLTGLVQNGYVFSSDQVFSLTYQLLEAAAFIHNFGLIHRDIKSSNILIDRSGLLKLADFGLTREVSPLMTNRVCTLWYRAPELLLGAQSYDLKVDSWSIGCVLLEMKMRRPPFKGNDEISQIKTIFECLGASPDTYLWSEVLDQKRYPVVSDWMEHMRASYGACLGDRMLGIVRELLRLSPKERISPANALKMKVLSPDDGRLIPIESEDVHEHYCKKGKTDECKAKF